MCGPSGNAERVNDCDPTDPKVGLATLSPLESVVTIQSEVFTKVSPLNAVNVTLPPLTVPVKTLCTSKLISDKVFGLTLGVGNTIALLFPSFSIALLLSSFIFKKSVVPKPIVLASLKFCPELICIS